jgi:hypothetical protein
MAGVDADGAGEGVMGEVADAEAAVDVDAEAEADTDVVDGAVDIATGTDASTPRTEQLLSRTLTPRRVSRPEKRTPSVDHIACRGT